MPSNLIICLSEDDYEGNSATMTRYGAILYGPVHMFLIHKVTWQLGNKKYRQNMLLELISIVILVSLVFYFRIDFFDLSYYSDDYRRIFNGIFRGMDCTS